MDLQKTTEQRIAQLQLQLAQQTQQMEIPLPTVQPPVKQESTEEMISRLLDEKLSKLIPVANNPVTVVEEALAEPLDYGTQLLIAIGSAITKEQQMWLSEVDNQMGIHGFLNTADGQAITRRFFKTYIEHKDTKCK